ncbi:MAG: hypothetical protein ACRDQD_01130 [Nocardioidaceae bacterium]
MSNAFAIGDLVQVRPQYARSADERARVWKVTKAPTGARGVNYVAVPVKADGTRIEGARGLRGPEDIWQAYDPDAPAVAEITTFKPSPNNGTVVTVKPPLKSAPADAVFVVLGPVKGSPDKTQVTVLGGSEAGYWRVPNDLLIEVEGPWNAPGQS